MYNRKRRTLLHAFVFALLFHASPAIAQEPQPGDACPEADLFMRVSGPENPGSGHFLFCDSGLVWQPIIRFLSNGHVLFSSGGTPAAPLHIEGEAIIGDSGLACGAAQEGALRYNSSGQVVDYCDGASWTSLSGGGGGGALNDLSDVTLTSPANGECLTYNGSAWVDGSCSGGSGGLWTDSGSGYIEYSNALGAARIGSVTSAAAPSFSASSAFTSLTDTPANFTGAGSQIVAVTSAEDGLEFIAAPDTSFAGLTDTPANFTGAGSQIVAVTSAEDGLEFIAAPDTSFAGLTDTPANFTGAAGQFVAVTSTEDGLEFVPEPSGGGGGGSGLWSDSGSGYIEYSSALGGILVGGVSGQPAPVMP